jgi:FtsZ-binding cell division protein ZapB
MAFDPIATLREWKQKVALLQERWRGARRENEQLRQENEQLRRREKQLASHCTGIVELLEGIHGDERLHTSNVLRCRRCHCFSTNP